MHSGFQIPAESEQHQIAANPDQNSSCTALLLSMNQTGHILEQIHGGTQQLFLDQPLFLPPPHHHQNSTRLSHHIYGGAPPSFFPVNFKLGLMNEVCSKFSNKEDGSIVSCINNEGEDGLLRGSDEQYLGMQHCWQNQEDSAITKNQTLREAEVSNENSDNNIVDTSQENTKTKDPPTVCLDTKNRALFGELEAIYKRLGTSERNQTGPSGENFRPVINADHAGYSEANSIGDDDQLSPPLKKINISTDIVNDHDKRKRRKLKKKRDNYDGLINPMAEFFEGLLKQMMNHQENLHRKFGEVMERIDQERRERDEAWRERETVRFEKEVEARARNKASVESREAAILSYLEKITGQRFNFQGQGMEPETTTNEK